MNLMLIGEFQQVKDGRVLTTNEPSWLASAKNVLRRTLCPLQEVAPQFHVTFPNKSLDCGRSFKEGLSPLFSMITTPTNLLPEA